MQRVSSISSQMYKSNKLTILYYNARSVLPKLSELQVLAVTYSPSIICIVETWLCSDIMDCEVSINNYRLIRLDRNRNGGGVLMFISVHLNFTVLPTHEGLELLTVIVSNQNCKSCISLFIGLQVLQLLC